MPPKGGGFRPGFWTSQASMGSSSLQHEQSGGGRTGGHGFSSWDLTAPGCETTGIRRRGAQRSHEHGSRCSLHAAPWLLTPVPQGVGKRQSILMATRAGLGDLAHQERGYPWSAKQCARSASADTHLLHPSSSHPSHMERSSEGFPSLKGNTLTNTTNISLPIHDFLLLVINKECSLHK